MKKLFLFLLITSNLFAQPDVEIRLVNQNVGTPQCEYILDYYQCISSNDSGLNSILSNYNVTSYVAKGGHPYLPYTGRVISIQGANSSQFISDLLAYTSVIESVKISNIGSFSDALNVTFVDKNIGVPTGTNGNIIVTNDTGLNQIFQTFNVFQFELMYPSITDDPTFLVYYKLTCNCDNSQLKIALDNYNSVILYSGLAQAGYLSNNQFKKEKASISPIPFEDILTITSNQPISNYSIFDISGKIIVNTNSKNDFDMNTSKLRTGIYILYLTLENGTSNNYKIIKK